MTNNTAPEMPVEIFATKFTWFSEPNPSGFIEYRPTVSYTRTDTIPSRAEVAREFWSAVISLNATWATRNMRHAMDIVLKEWEDAESKTNSI